jgi:hypothetical protein
MTVEARIIDSEPLKPFKETMLKISDMVEVIDYREKEYIGKRGKIIHIARDYKQIPGARTTLLVIKGYRFIVEFTDNTILNDLQERQLKKIEPG